MIIQSGTLIAGVAGTPYCAAQCCKYTVNVANFGSDADDDPYYLIGVQTTTGLVTFPGDKEPDMRNYVLLEDALNALGIGKFGVMPIQDDRIQITSEDNPNTLVGIKYRIEGTALFLPFKECDCHDLPVCEPDIEKCTYYLYRKFETSNDDKIRLKAIKFVNGQPHFAPTPIDTSDYKAIANFINSFPESEGKFESLYSNNTLTLQAKSLRYKPEYVVWQFETSVFGGGTATTDKQTFFVKNGCYTDCCCCCGGDGQPPCNNKVNGGCNTPLALHLDGVCRPACVPGTAYVAGFLVPAGNVGQPVDCAGKCFGDLVPTTYGCQPKNQKATVCDLGFVVETNENEKLLSIAFGNLGLFTPPLPILLGDGLDVLAWLNAPETGLCPAGTGNCVSVTVSNIPESTLKKYVFTLTQVNIDVNGVKSPITTTVQFCGSDHYHSCIEPAGCAEVDLQLTCPHGQIYNINFARCVDTTPQNWCAGFTPGNVGAASVPCSDYQPPTTEEYKRTKEALIQGEILVIQSTYNAQVVQWFASRGLATDYRGFAIHNLVSKGKLPEWEEICYHTANGKVHI